MKKRIVGILLAVLICSLAAGPVYARWSNVESIKMTLTFSNGQANASSTIKGYSDTNDITATYSLQEKNGNDWMTVHTWPSVYTNGRTLTFTDSAPAASGITYRLYVTTTVTNSAGTPETVTDYLEKTY